MLLEAAQVTEAIGNGEWEFAADIGVSRSQYCHQGHLRACQDGNNLADRQEDGESHGMSPERQVYGCIVPINVNINKIYLQNIGNLFMCHTQLPACLQSVLNTPLLNSDERKHNII